MVSFFSKLAVIATIVASSVSGLEIGEYSRPSGAEVSSVPGATAPYLRSPCPTLNTLANHGYLPRDGKKITSTMIADAIVEAFNIDPILAKGLVSQVRAKGTIDLAFLSTHNFIEHDVSFAHSDFSYGDDMSALNVTMWDDFSSRAVNNVIGIEQVAATLEDRVKVCNNKPEGCDYGIKQRVTGAIQAAFVLRAFGGKNEETASLDNIKAFFVDERFPDGYAKPSTKVSITKLFSTAIKVGVKTSWLELLEFLDL
ncbi:hypothetical protein Poli38472_011555 [Pythium oligandrum]|uniref:Heme haloperoxidase family profile domain-containing protein n=1 Tax=Pythium oligandrum TaxID=41045 RepID=A0A8K1CK10_PYTOL|nr:hypothetical protein Poli38472_011555 [Pythium oligandrum]|eukprot:TMW64675.1 hypothetical protein Poli38472_011555 [Pythium oligandrum]